MQKSNSNLNTEWDFELLDLIKRKREIQEKISELTQDLVRIESRIALKKENPSWIHKTDKPQQVYY